MNRKSMLAGLFCLALVSGGVEHLVIPQFFSWVTGIGEGMTIIGPTEVVNEYRAYLERLVRKYE